MTDTRAGLMKVATIRVDRAHGAAAAIVAAGDEWIASDEIRRIRSETVAAEGGDVALSVIELKSGAVIRTQAGIEDEVGGLLPMVETARSNLATAQFQPLVNELQQRNPDEVEP